MSAPLPRPASRYRRRILVLGAAATLVLIVVGAPIFNNRIEDDLERRVPDALADAGFAGVSATFSGQDGTLVCASPLDAPEEATRVAYDVWGVHQIELERSCRVNRAPTVEDGTTEPAEEITDPESAAADTASDTAATVAVTTTDVAPDFATIAEVIETDPQFSLLVLLGNDAGLSERLSDPAAGPFTFFAPSDDVLDELDADVVAGLVDDDERLDLLMAHHLVEGRYSAADLAGLDGESLTAVDGTELAVGNDGSGITVGGAVVTDGDLMAGNGIVHVIDRILLPDDVDLAAPEPMGSAAVTLDDGTLVLMGLVAGEAERDQLVAAAADAVGATNVDDQLDIDAEIGVDAGGVADLAVLVAALPDHLVSGRVEVDADGLAVAGDYATVADRDAMLAVADEVGATADLELRPDATADDAADLEADLNEYVAANPITFAPNSADLTLAAFAIIDRVALEAQEFGGVAITVEGHTDSDGTPAANVQLSQLRADAVRVALIERGVDAASITAEGFGSEQPVLVDGVEDKDASRRVEFRVVATG